MPQLKFTYFDGRARGELSRLVMAAAKKEMEQVRLSFEEWGKIKPTTLYGCVPTLRVDGKEFCQGLAIATYLARENGLYGDNNLDCLMIDQCVHLKEDLLLEEIKTVFGTEESKKEAVKKLAESVYPRIFKIWSMCIKQNPAKSGFLVGNKLTLGDLAIFEGCTNCMQNSPAALDNFPEIKALREKVASSPGVKEYLAKRKQTPV